jgi:hypothetical protein
MSVTPDSFLKVKENVIAAERALRHARLAKSFTRKPSRRPILKRRDNASGGQTHA